MHEMMSEDIDANGSPKAESLKNEMPLLNPKSLTSDNIYMFLRKTPTDAYDSKDKTKSFKYEEHQNSYEAEMLKKEELKDPFFDLNRQEA